MATSWARKNVPIEKGNVRTLEGGLERWRARLLQSRRASTIQELVFKEKPRLCGDARSDSAGQHVPDSGSVGEVHHVTGIHSEAGVGKPATNPKTLPRDEAQKASERTPQMAAPVLHSRVDQPGQSVVCQAP